MKTLLLIAETETEESIGGKFLRAAKSSEIRRSWRTRCCYTSPATHHSPSMNKLTGKLFYRIADKRSWEWWEFQQKLEQEIRLTKPSLILVTGILPLRQQVFKAARECGSYFSNYLTDDPWNRIHKRRSFIINLPEYDHIFSTKEELREKLRNHGAKSTSWLPFAYEPEFHKPPEFNTKIYRETPDILFIGTGAHERLQWLNALSEIPNVSRHIHGNGWKGVKPKNWEIKPSATGEQYCKVLYNAKITLGILRQANRDLSTMRSYEIGAIGACGLYQDTTEHRTLLPDYPEEGFFKTPAQLRGRVISLLNDPELRNQLREQAMESIRQPQNTYLERLKSIIKQLEK